MQVKSPTERETRQAGGGRSRPLRGPPAPPTSTLEGAAEEPELGAARPRGPGGKFPRPALPHRTVAVEVPLAGHRPNSHVGPGRHGGCH